MIFLRDQLQRPLEFHVPPRRIVSLVPSITELVCDLDLRDRLIGVTKFCIHPYGLTMDKAVVGGTKNVNVAKVEALRPNLVLASKEENVQEQIEAAAELCPVYVSDVRDMATARQMIADIGLITDTEAMAKHLIKKMDAALLAGPTPDKRPRVAYIIWKKPFMVAGGDTYISAMLESCGMENMFAGQNRYPTVAEAEFSAQGCDAILLSSEPYPFKESDRVELERRTGIPCLLVDGEMFSWYGSRIPEGIKYGRAILNGQSTEYNGQ